MPCKTKSKQLRFSCVIIESRLPCPMGRAAVSQQTSPLFARGATKLNFGLTLPHRHRHGTNTIEDLIWQFNDDSYDRFPWNVTNTETSEQTQLQTNKETQVTNKIQYPPYEGGQISDLGITWEHLSKRLETHPWHICAIMQHFTPVGATVAEISVTKTTGQKANLVPCHTNVLRVN